MNEKFEEFCAEVCSYVNHATSKEKRDIEAELTSHLLDHRDAMVSQGLSPTEAEAHALAAMGDPAEVGRELNKEYPLLWLIVSRIAAVLTALFLLMSCMALSSRVDHVYHNLQARWAPMSVGLGDGYENVQELDLRFELEGGDIMKVYGVSTMPGINKTWGCVFCCVYDRNIFSPIYGNHIHSVEIESSVERHGWSSSRGFGNAVDYAVCEITLGEGDEELTFYYEHNDLSYSAVIPLPKEDEA